MSTITREHLRERAREKVKSLEFAVTQTAFADIRVELEEELELARIALASLEADGALANEGTITATQFKPVADLYEVTVPNGRSTTFTKDAAEASDCRVMGWSVQEYVKLERYQAAMIQGTENAGSPTTMKTAPALDSSPKIAEATSGNSPVIPDDWVLVPIEPTEDMIVNGFESEPDESFSDEKVWEEYDAMSGCQQAAHRAKLCWAAMIAASPAYRKVNRQG